MAKIRILLICGIILISLWDFTMADLVNNVKSAESCDAEEMLTCDKESKDSKECISTDKVCNGIAECYNGRDESVAVCGCAADEFQCDNVTCIDSIKRCDLTKDCKDGRDELNCDIYTCPPSHIKCANHACIPRHKLCNFADDCGDNSDENLCVRRVCSHSEWTCANKDCILLGYLCDGEKNCLDGSDEMNCSRHTVCAPGMYVPEKKTCDGWVDCKYSMTDELNCGRCKESQYTCSNSRCIPKAHRCDGVCDCGNNCDDELNCNAICSDDKFVCRGHFTTIRCLDRQYVCDGVNQCSDSIEGSDETYCKGNVTSKCEGLCKWCQIFYGESCSTREDIDQRICKKFVNCDNVKGKMCNDTMEWRCPDGSCLAKSQRCDGHADCHYMSDEIDCEDEYCPKYKFRCLNGQCLSMNNRCDFKRDCWDGSDELNCEMPQSCKADEFQCDNKQCIPKSMMCLDVEGQGCADDSHKLDCMSAVCPKGFVKCHNSICIPESKVCNGRIDCLMSASDEIGCFFGCPYPTFECKCLGDEMFCENSSLQYVPNTEHEHGLAKYFLAFNLIGHNLTNSTLETHGNASFSLLDLSSNEITEVIPGLFEKMWRLRTLLLSNNLITSLKQGAFRGLANVKTLSLDGNQIAHIEAGAFGGVYKLTSLNLSYQQLTEIQMNAFIGMKNLYKLNLDGNKITFIANGAFNGLKKLKYLDISNNPLGMTIENFVFNGLSQLNELHTDEYRFCCLASHVDTCYPKPNEFSSCEDLMSNFVLRVCIWILGMLSTFGNALVIMWRIFDNRENSKIHSFLITHLAIADMLMGVYLLTIASVDSYFRGIYILHDISWRQSLLCHFSGFLSTFSSELSVFTLTVITMDRFVTIIFPFHFHRMGIVKARSVMVGLWIFAATLSAIPLCGIAYFNNFYGRSGVCLALHITNERPNGWEYSVFVFLVLNFVSFTMIMIAYLWMFVVASKTQAAARGEEIQIQSRTEKAMARRMALIVSTDFFCWMPIILLGFASLAGVKVAPQVYAWVAVFVLPVNSAINPIIYTLSTANFIKQTRGKIFKFRKSFMTSLATGNDTKISLTSGDTVSIADNRRKFFVSKKRLGTMTDANGIQNYTSRQQKQTYTNNRLPLDYKRQSEITVKSYIPLVVKKESTRKVKSQFTS